MFTRLLHRELGNKRLLTRSYADIINEIRKKSTETRPKVNRFAQQYSQPKTDQKGGHQGVRSRNHGTKGAGDPAVGNSGPKKLHHKVQRTSSHGKVQPRGVGKNHTSNSNKMRDFDKQIASSAPHLSKEEIEKQKMLKYEELRKDLARQEQQEKHQRDDMVRIQPLRKRKVRKIKEQRKPLVKIQLTPFISVSNLATIMQVPLNDVFKKLEGLGFEDIRHSYILDKENAAMIADEYDIEVETVAESDDDLFSEPVKEELLKERPPVVTIMGHVDHGKTTILDYLRKSSIVSGEFGGITQHIGAFSVVTPKSRKKITFLDTPGHAAFLKMRERGAIITDIVILVVAADDSVMPQTIEAIKHAKKAGVPMIVALNKCDKPGVNVDKVLGDLAAQDIDIEDYGGETQTVQVSGKTGLNMDKLEEAIITLSELNDFKAEEKGVAAEGWVIESELVKGMGNVATVLVRRGSLKNGDVIVAGETFCKIRGMKDEKGKIVKLAGPSTPVQIWGWKELPDSGDHIIQARLEQIAKKVIDFRIARAQQIQASRDIEDINIKRAEEIKEAERLEKIAELKKAGLDSSELEREAQDTKITKCNYIIKSDVFGSAEAIKESIHELGNDEVQSCVISHSAGAPTDSDLDMAKTFNATIFCFNIKPPKQIVQRAEREKINIVEHNIIYRLIEQVTEELSSHLKPRIETKILGEVDIKDIFTITQGKSKIKVAGCKVATGVIKRSSDVKVLRGDKEVFKGTLSSLKHVKDDISEARKGNECGLGFHNWTGFEAGDKILVYEEIEHKRYL